MSIRFLFGLVLIVFATILTIGIVYLLVVIIWAQTPVLDLLTGKQDGKSVENIVGYFIYGLAYLIMTIAAWRYGLLLMRKISN